jgi:protein arginine N-methyltransferase 1
MDARARFLAPGGAQIPARDHLVVAGVEAPELFARVVSPWSDAPMRLSLTAARDAVVNWMHADTDHPIQPGQLVTEPCRWATLDYSTLSSPSASGRAALSATRSTKAHGLAVWFEAELDQLAKYSTGPGSQRVYGRAFFPFPTAVDIEAGDVVTVDLQATWAGDRYLWGWQTQVASPGSAPRASFRQSTFLGTPFSLEQLRRDLPTHRPVLSARGECDRAVLGWMDGSRTLGDLATRLHHTHPTIAASDADAMAHVRRLVRQCAK